jgi:hypothetical protein
VSRQASFSFDVAVPEAGLPEGTLDDLATRMLEFVGCGSDAAVIARDLQAAVTTAAVISTSPSPRATCASGTRPAASHEPLPCVCITP